MSVRPLLPALAAAGLAAFVPAADACDRCGHDPCPCPTVSYQPVVYEEVVFETVAYPPVAAYPEPTLHERIAAKRLARLERRAARIRARYGDPYCPPGFDAPVYGAGHAGFHGYGY